MKILALILALILAIAAIASGLQAPLHYKYKYFGNVRSGIFEISHQASEWGMFADVEVFIDKNNGNAVFKVTNLKQYEFLGEVKPELPYAVSEDKALPIQDEELRKAIEEPFIVNLFGKEDFSINYSENKFKWLANVQKGVVSIFKNEILRGNSDYQVEGTVASAFHKGKFLNVFSVEEDTLFGRCIAEYTIHSIPEHMAEIQSRKMYIAIEEDIQRDDEKSSALKEKPTKTKKQKSKTAKKTTKSSKTTKTAEKYRRPDVPELKDELWHVTRSVNFDKCSERVEVQISSFDETRVSGNQEKWFRSRSSVSEYILRGSPGHFRLEGAKVDGATTMNPFGFETEVMQTRVQQWLNLVSVTVGGPVPGIRDNLKSSHSWMYEVRTFTKPPSISKPHPWVIYTGEDITPGYVETYGVDSYSPEELATMKDVIIENINKVALSMTDFDQEEPEPQEGQHADLLYQTALLMKMLPKANILKIFDKFFEKDLHQSDVLAKKLVIDVAAASGSYFGFSAVLDYIKSEKIPDIQIMSIFMMLAANSESPANVPELLDYVLTLDIQKNPFVASTVLVNFAHFLDEFCVNPTAGDTHYPGQLTGDEGCQKKLIAGTFVPYLKDIIYSDKPTWVKAVAIKALDALGSPLSIQILFPIIEGKTECCEKVRIYAINAIEGWKLFRHPKSKDVILDLLTDIFTDVAERADVREAALTAAASWLPELNFWHRLARLSWREPSKRFASYMTSTIMTFANARHPYFTKTNQAASHALKFAKPVIPGDLYSLGNTYVTQLLDKHVLEYTGATIQFSKRLHSVFELTIYLMNEFGGFTLENLELRIKLYGNEWFKQMYNDYQNHERSEHYDPKSREARIAESFYSKIEDTIKIATTKTKKTPEIEAFLRIFKHMNIFLPFNKDTISHLPYMGDKTKLAALAVQLAMGFEMLRGKYFNPIDIKVFHPTELGLPLIATTIAPIVVSDVSYTKVTMGKTLAEIKSVNNVYGSKETLTSGSSLYSSGIYVILPWNKKIVGTGVMTGRSFVLPFREELTTTKKEEYGNQDIVHLALESLYSKRFHVFRAGNFPFTTITSMIPIRKVNPDEINLVDANLPHVKNIHIPSQYTGLEFEASWHSALPFPLSFWELHETLSDHHTVIGSPWIIYALTSPTARFWLGTLTFDPELSETNNITVEHMIGSFGKAKPEEITQETGDYFSQYGQETYDQVGQESDNQFEQEPGFDQAPEFEEIGGTDEVETLPHATYGDSLNQRSLKMQEYFGGSVYTYGIKIDFNGDKHRGYELSFTTAKPSSTGTRRVQKSQLTFIRSPIPYVDPKPIAACLNLQSASPILTYLDTVEELLKQNLDLDIQILFSPDCSPKHTISLKETLHISEPWHKYYHFENVDTFSYNAAYDKVKATLEWEKLCDYKKYPITSSLVRSLDWLNSHFISHTCEKDDSVKHSIVFDLDRCPATGLWKTTIKSKDSETVIGPMPHDEHVDQFFSLDLYSGKHPLAINNSTSSCIIKTDFVTTFDGEKYQYEPSQCWSVAVKDCTTDDKTILLVRSPQGEAIIPELKYIDVTKGLVVEYTRGVVKVNGKTVDPVGEKEEITNENNHPLVTVFKKRDYYGLYFSESFFITIKDVIEVHTHLAFSDSLCGLCGDNDGEITGELIGPHGCFYNDPKTFVASWTAGSDTCDLYTLLELRENAEKYQETCKPLIQYPTKCPYFNERCVKVGWKVISTDGLSCVSYTALPYCEESCEVVHTTDQLVSFNCWPEDKAPVEIKEALAGKQIYIATPIAYAPYYQKNLPISIPSDCKNY